MNLLLVLYPSVLAFGHGTRLRASTEARRQMLSDTCLLCSSAEELSQSLKFCKALSLLWGARHPSVAFKAASSLTRLRTLSPRANLHSIVPFASENCHRVGCARMQSGLQPPEAAAGPSIPPIFEKIVNSTLACLEAENTQGKYVDGSWCFDEQRKDLMLALEGLRGKKASWWLDSPKPLRSVISSGPRHEISVIALPGSLELPAAAYPLGSNIFVQPLVGQVEFRRVRKDKSGRRELSRRTLRQTDSVMVGVGGACQEWSGAPGVASAFLQVVMLPPVSRFPDSMQDDMRGNALGWATPPAEGCADKANIVRGVTIPCALDDILILERPSEAVLAWEEDPYSKMPDDAPSLVERLRSRVGGLDGPLAVIVRRGLASRLYPAALTRELGVSPVRGMLLYGPPGCGKTLLAREIAAALGAREPKIVNGPEMMSKYVGDSEQYIRGLFAEAELEQAEKGDESALHIIVFDEIDAFTRERGSLRGDSSGVRDSVVNQLLAKLDGVEQLNNVLVIGLTNRPELLDSALLRPGRLEVQVPIPTPDAEGRQQILNIHTAQLRERRALDAEAVAAISSGALASVTKAFSGADLAGLIRSATSFALERYVNSALLKGWDPGVVKKTAFNSDASRRDDVLASAAKAAGSSILEVSFDDLLRALREVSPTRSRKQAKAANAWSFDVDVSEISRKPTSLRGWWRERQLKAKTGSYMSRFGVRGHTHLNAI